MNGIISRHCQHLRVHVDDYRLAFGTPEQKAAVLRQIERRSEGAKRGWAKRHAAQAIETQRATTENTGVVRKDESAVGETDAPQISPAKATPHVE